MRKLATVAQDFGGRRLENGEAADRRLPALRHRERHQAAEGMADQMHRPAGAADDGLDDLRLAPQRGVLRRAAFLGAAIAQQAGGDAAEAAVPGGDHRPPGGGGAAGTGQENDGRSVTAARALLIVIDGAVDMVDHRKNSTLLVR